ncbi:MAG: AzlD domain-containing protein [Synergistaceae bacterium]|nr:AzlD domain-containing protein [Synergistaceae bacterium]
MSGTWVIIAGMALVTSLPRVIPILLLTGRKMPKIVTRWLALIAPAILSALLLPELLVDRSGISPSLSFYNLYLFAALLTSIVGWKTRSLFCAVMTGIAAVALVRFF